MDEAPALSNKQITTKQIHEILLQFGIPPHLHGYSYLLYALQLAIEKPDSLHYITKGLYIDTAKHFNTTPAKVERAMRTAIGTAWLNGDYEFNHSLFRNSVKPEKGIPSNSIFLSRIYYYLQDLE